MRFQISDHAVDRYRERINPNLSYVEAKQHIEDGLDQARRLKQRTFQGEEMWQLANGAVMVVGRCKYKGGLHVVKSVITEEQAKGLERNPMGEDEDL